MPKRLGGIIGCKDKTSSWHLNRFPSNYTTIGSYSLEHKERYDSIIGEEWYIFDLQQVHRGFLPCHLFGACLYFTLRVTFVTAG